MERKFSVILITLFGVFQISSSSFASGGSCRESGLCCPGRDPSCLVKNYRSNDIAEEFLERSCYCDAACRTVGDCCSDYEDTCGASDCIVDDFGPWSSCDVECGRGIQTRERRVIQETRNGGKSCPELTQKRSCVGLNCENPRAAVKASKESALILPSSYSSLRKFNSSLDIRSNLRVRYPKDPLKEKSHEYCVVFEVLKSRKGCDLAENPLHRLLTIGRQVCVSCASAAMRKNLGYRCHGHGVDETPTRFSSVTASNCHGRWVRKGSYELCPCHADAHPDFIFI